MIASSLEPLKIGLHPHTLFTGRRRLKNVMARPDAGSNPPPAFPETPPGEPEG